MNYKATIHIEPLPAPSTPEKPVADKEFWRAEYAVMQGEKDRALEERDAALAQASEAAKRMTDIQKEFGRIQGTDAKQVVDRFLDLMRKLNEKDLPAGFESWEAFLKYTDGIKARAVAAESELAALRTSVPVWVPLAERVPAEKDGQEMKGLSGLPFYGMVIWGAVDFACFGHYDKQPAWATCWMRVPKLPLPPLPVETEEGDDDAGFDEWIASKPWPNKYFSPNATEEVVARLAWQAALRSKKP